MTSTQTPTDLAETIVRLLRPGSDDFAEDTRRVAQLIEEWLEDLGEQEEKGRAELKMIEHECPQLD